MSFQKSTWWDLSVKVYLIKLSLERKSTESSDSLEDQTCEREVLDLQSVHLREQNSSNMLHVTCSHFNIHKVLEAVVMIPTKAKKDSWNSRPAE